MDAPGGEENVSERVSRRDLLRHMVTRVAGVLSEGRRRPGTLEVPYIPYTVRPKEEEGT
jgi:hypothetical protein